MKMDTILEVIAEVLLFAPGVIIVSFFLYALVFHIECFF